MPAIDELQNRLRAAQVALTASRPAVPAPALVAAVVAAQSTQLQREPATSAMADLFAGRPVPARGDALALAITFGAPAAMAIPAAEIAAIAATVPVRAWAGDTLIVAGELAGMVQVAMLVESGAARLAVGPDGGFVAWLASRRLPAAWWERADFDWWAAHARATGETAGDMSGQAHLSASTRPEAAGSGNAPADLSEALAFVARLDYQFPYPEAAIVGGLAVATYRRVLAGLLVRLAADRRAGREQVPVPSNDLAATLAVDLGLVPATVLAALAGFTLTAAGAAHHAVGPGIAPPLIEVAPELLLLSAAGLSLEPLLFLARELRRRDPESYHNAAIQRESRFRSDLAGLFSDRRFLVSSGPVELRRDGGNARTDLDVVVFDRKANALGLFELKSQDPFARTAAELTRQRDNVLQANRQVAGALDWIRQHGADAVLARVDGAVAKRFRVQKVLPFVLGRYLVHFPGGPAPDPRAAWGTWPQVLRLAGPGAQPPGEPLTLASLFNRLRNDSPPLVLPHQLPAAQLVGGDLRLTLYASYEAARAGGLPR